ncbi:HNH endonuclease [Paraburkholderia youngii]|uniref:HNH endonuclease n=1 Tax=Paraburkholderia youngii TaxID=2782701 RepID=A0A7Y6N126_9BURK|nr:HNH endonuclease [Paraburkholderia youngii]NUY03542.1 HNH endonuclease [Paraburkholderia youngii]
MSQALTRLSPDERRLLKERLWQRQNGQCFITRKAMDLSKDDLEIDHIIPSRDKGPDDESNWALVFARANESKQASHLYVARVLYRLEEIRHDAKDTRGANLGDVLSEYGGSKHSIRFSVENDNLCFKMPEKGFYDETSVPIWRDDLSGMRTAFLRLPIEYLHHDYKINPRPIGNSIRGLVEEFHRKRPQLHVPLAWIDLNESGGSRVRIFDGQHKAAAQVLLDQTWLPVRVFVDPDTDVLITANTNAGTNLRQVAFDKSTQRFLGASILGDRIDRFLKDKGKRPGEEGFSERDLVEHFRGEQAQMRRYVLDAQRNAISHHEDNKLRDFIEWGGKGTDKPISYSSIEKTFFSQFLGKDMLESPFYGVNAEGENPRDLERRQMVQLMSLIAEKFYTDGKYDFERGVDRIESKVQKGDNIPDNHLRAYRIGREEVMTGWLPFVSKVIVNYFTMNGRNVRLEKLFQYKFPSQLWTIIGNFLDHLGRLPLWVDYQLSQTAFGGKPPAGFWDQVFDTGNSPNGTPVIHTGGLNVLEMIKPL